MSVDLQGEEGERHEVNSKAFLPYRILHSPDTYVFDRHPIERASRDGFVPGGHWALRWGGSQKQRGWKEG